MLASATVPITAADYPPRLAEAAGAPRILHLLGTLPRAEIAVAIVGARAATVSSVDRAREVSRELAAAGILVVSGGAFGIDSAAHRGALDAARPTVAVLAGGLDAPYPMRNRPLFDQIFAAGGALLSLQPPGAAPLPGTFIARNRAMAGLCDAVLVVEAKLGSGSLTTAAAARSLGRFVAAMPGSPGCEMLLARGAALVERAADLIDALRGAPRRPSVRMPEPGTREAAALAALEVSEPASGAAVAARSGLDLRAALRALAGLEMEGLAFALPGHTYVRSPVADQLMQG